MADVKIDDLSAVTTASGNMQLETDIGGTTANKITVAQLETYVKSSIGSTNITNLSSVAGGTVTDALDNLEAAIPVGALADFDTITSAGLIDNGIITVGKLDTAGIPSSSTYLRGDGAWASVAGGVSQSSVDANASAIAVNEAAITSLGAVNTSINSRITSVDDRFTSVNSGISSVDSRVTSVQGEIVTDFVNLTDTSLATGSGTDGFAVTWKNADSQFVLSSVGGTGGSTQNLFETITGDTGSTTANSATDTLNLVGGVQIETSVTGDTLTVFTTGVPFQSSVDANTSSITVLLSARSSIVSGQVSIDSRVATVSTGLTSVDNRVTSVNDLAVYSDPSAVSGAVSVENMFALTSAQYAGVTTVSDTFYIITDAS